MTEQRTPRPKLKDQPPAESRKINQLDRLLGSLGARTEEGFAIKTVIDYFEAREFKKTIPGKDYLARRLVDLTQGKRIPLVVFNCLDFSWVKSIGEYPRAVILDDTSTSIVDYFQEELQSSINALNALSPNNDGGVDVCIIVPDSELLDERVFPFTQSEDERTEIALKVKAVLSERFKKLQKKRRNPVMLWSEYCRRYGLQSPTTYTANNASIVLTIAETGGRNEKEKNLLRSILKQRDHSREHFINKGLVSGYVQYDIPSQEMLERIIWYCAMYMGEGQALAESDAIVLNFEDFRVGKWYNIGSSDKLPIITPVNPNNYYAWRKQQKSRTGE